MLKSAPVACELTAHKLKRWRREGLIPRPSQIHPGGQRGSASLYPSQTVDQVKTVCSLLSRDRRLDQLKFWLWWEGHWVDHRAIRESLTGMARESLERLEVLRRPRSAKLPAAERAARKAFEIGVRSPLLRLLRHRLQRDPSNTTSALTFFFLMLMGGDLSWGAEAGLEDLDELTSQEILARALGIKKLTADVETQTGEELSFDIPESIQQLEGMGLIPVSRMPNLISEATEGELALARDDVHFLGREFPLLIRVMKMYMGRDPFGLGIIAIHGREGRDFPERMAMLVPFSVGIRRSGDSMAVENFDLLKTELRKLVPVAESFLARKEGG